MKLTVGSQMPDFTFSTPYKENISLSGYLNGEKAAIFFLRYYGCTVCQLQLHKLKEAYELFKQKGVKILAVLQSNPETIKSSMEEGFFPFDIICDENQALYKEFEIGSAASKDDLRGGTTVEDAAEAKSMGFVHGAYEGNELQLPATFVVDKDLKVTISHYGASASDSLKIDVILESIA